jgi:hypothetical protein
LVVRILSLILYWFTDSIDKTVVMHICRKRIWSHEDPRITLGNRVLDVRKDHQDKGLHTGQSVKLEKAHIRRN